MSALLTLSFTARKLYIRIAEIKNDGVPQRFTRQGLANLTV